MPMPMLRPDEFAVGALRDARAPCLLLPRDKYEHAALVVSPDALIAICLDEDPRSAFRSFACNDNDAWTGLLIPEVTLEVDVSTLFDPNSKGFPLGTLIRQDNQLSISARRGDGFGDLRVPVQLALGSGTATLSAGFYRWTIGLGSGRDRRVLFTADRTPKGGEHA